MTNTREIVLDALMEILEKKQYSHYVLKQILDKYSYLDKTERSFIKRITEGTVERCLELDYILDAFSRTPVRKMKPMIRTILRMGVYQLIYMDSVPDSAVCNEAVKLAVNHSFSSLRGFVNGILRNIARNKASITYPDAKENPEAYLSVTYSMPEWIVHMWYERFGAEKTEEILKGLLSNRPVTVRLEEALSEKERVALLEQMAAAGITAEQDKELAYAYRLSGVDRVDAVPGFADGKIMIQDAGSMYITQMAGITPGDYVIDVCGAPGGKALHAASKLKGQGFVDVRDLSNRKVSMMEENIQRSSFTNIHAKVFDATVLDEECIERADVVIADLPCSGLGVIARKSDIKYRLTEGDIKDIAALQKKILSTVWQYVKPGGKLMYSTCTLTKEENEDNMKWFLENFPFQRVEERTLFPGVDDTDGFYMMLLCREEN